MFPTALYVYLASGLLGTTWNINETYTLKIKSWHAESPIAAQLMIDDA